MIVLGMDFGVVLAAATWLVGVALIVVMALLPWLDMLAGPNGPRRDR